MSNDRWTNEHDWGTPEQQQANIDVPDERKVTTVTRWAVLLNGYNRMFAVIAAHHFSSRAEADALREDWDRCYPKTAPHRVVRLDITISEDDSAAENARSQAESEGV